MLDKTHGIQCHRELLNLYFTNGVCRIYLDKSMLTMQFKKLIGIFQLRLQYAFFAILPLFYVMRTYTPPLHAVSCLIMFEEILY